MSQFSDRTFGVEIECGFDPSNPGRGDDRSDVCAGEAAERPNPCGECAGCTVVRTGGQTYVQMYGADYCYTVSDAINEAYANCECRSCYDERGEDYGEDGALDEAMEIARRASGLSDWGGCFDGTLIEVKTPILSGDDGIEAFRKAMVAIREAGGYVTSSDGMHVHHGMPELVDEMNRQAGGRWDEGRMTGPKLIRVVESWINNEPLIDKFIAPDRVNSHWCNKSLTKANVIAAKQQRVNLYGAHGALNIDSLDYLGTIEVRLHEGTLNDAQAAAWVRFGQAFFDRALEISKPIGVHSTCSNLLRSLGVTGEYRDTLLARAKENSGLVQVAF